DGKLGPRPAGRLRVPSSRGGGRTFVRSTRGRPHPGEIEVHHLFSFVAPVTRPDVGSEAWRTARINRGRPPPRARFPGRGLSGAGPPQESCTAGIRARYSPVRIIPSRRAQEPSP